MKYNSLGKSGIKISQLSLGSWITFGDQVDNQTSKKLMKTAYDNGINFFDNAESYAQGKSETIMGKILVDFRWPRESFLVSSKVFWGGTRPTQRGLSKKHIFDACNNALKRLQLSYLDFFFCHRPDSDTPMEETVRAMHQLIISGKVLYWGTSEWNADQIVSVRQIAKKYNLIAPVMEQPQYHWFARDRIERDYLQFFKTKSLGTLTYSPLASGLLTGKYLSKMPNKTRINLPKYNWLKNRFESKEYQLRFPKIEKIQKIAFDNDFTLAQLAIAWCMSNPNVNSVILGASSVKQLKENLASILKLKLLTREMLLNIDNILNYSANLR